VCGQARWGDVDEVMGALNINQTRKLYFEPVGRSGYGHGYSVSSAEYPHAGRRERRRR